MSFVSNRPFSNIWYFTFYFGLFYVWSRRYDLRGILLVAFVRSSLDPWGDNASAGEGHYYLTFYVALFLIHSIWEQVPNTFPLSNGHLDRVSFLLNQTGHLDPSQGPPQLRFSCFDYKSLKNKNGEEESDPRTRAQRTRAKLSL
jgi:hypothetical protein